MGCPRRQELIVMLLAAHQLSRAHGQEAQNAPALAPSVTLHPTVKVAESAPQLLAAVEAGARHIVLTEHLDMTSISSDTSDSVSPSGALMLHPNTLSLRGNCTEDPATYFHQGRVEAWVGDNWQAGQCALLFAEDGIVTAGEQSTLWLDSLQLLDARANGADGFATQLVIKGGEVSVTRSDFAGHSGVSGRGVHVVDAQVSILGSRFAGYNTEPGGCLLATVTPGNPSPTTLLTLNATAFLPQNAYVGVMSEPPIPCVFLRSTVALHLLAGEPSAPAPPYNAPGLQLPGFIGAESNTVARFSVVEVYAEKNAVGEVSSESFVASMPDQIVSRWAFGSVIAQRWNSSRSTVPSWVPEKSAFPSHYSDLFASLEEESRMAYEAEGRAEGGGSGDKLLGPAGIVGITVAVLAATLTIATAACQTVRKYSNRTKPEPSNSSNNGLSSGQVATGQSTALLHAFSAPRSSSYGLPPLATSSAPLTTCKAFDVEGVASGTNVLPSFLSSTNFKTLLDPSHDPATAVSEADALTRYLDALSRSHKPFLGLFCMLGAMHRRSGGQGTVQFARNVNSDEAVAIKFFLHRAAFECEAALYALPTLRGCMPAIVRVGGNEEGALEMSPDRRLPPFIVVERGEALDEWAMHIQPDFVTIMQVLSHIAKRLQQLHAAGWVHRDLKPANVLWRPKHHAWTLIDFGCAARCGEEAPLTFSLRYTPPEVVAAVERGDRRCVAAEAHDVWALGVMAYELLTGESTFPKFTDQAAIFGAIAGRLSLPWEGPAAPEALQRLRGLRDSVLGCLERNPLRRPTAAGLLQAWNQLFDAVLEGNASGSPHTLHAAIDTDRTATTTTAETTEEAGRQEGYERIQDCGATGRVGDMSCASIRDWQEASQERSGSGACGDGSSWSGAQALEVGEAAGSDTHGSGCPVAIERRVNGALSEGHVATRDEFCHGCDSGHCRQHASVPWHPHVKVRMAVAKSGEVSVNWTCLWDDPAISND